ncbi:HpcH/HpaI aldolase/citrate lyase family protein [Actinophytocola xanthii]|uniref:HpcH/HpaI aldolase/citrate lyase family protein n=1 Tax=Actinophytocola xanthii TaxID=1912961 RepID=UPI0009FA126D|nr:CoA ester lyase [Actinophytocola xanthii]
MYTRYCRSMLCTPATATERYARCHRSGADICLVDLEDSVPLPHKEDARRRAEDFLLLAAAGEAPVRCAVRINAVSEPDGLRDLLALRDYRTPPEVVLVPKVESPRDVEIVHRVLGPRPELFAVVETPLGVERVEAIAAGSPGLRAVIFGSADYALAMGIDLAWEPLSYARARVVNAALAAGVHAIDSPTFELADQGLLRHESVLAVSLGFSGKIALHPDQVPVINEVFSPDAARLELAHRVVAAGRRSGLGITTVDGAMVGRPFFEASRRLLEEFGPPGEPGRRSPPGTPGQGENHLQAPTKGTT